jgi:sucrose-6-phosphate hydrolase SacC (GH32 family)
LPRELSLAPDGSMQQRYISELQMLRKGSPELRHALAFPDAGSPPKALGLKGGAQLEISATISFNPSATSGRFGLGVLCGEVGGVLEHTDVGLDLATQQVFIDRRNSSAHFTDTDIRAGPIPKTLAQAGEVKLHAYIDHSIVTVIFENQTALSVWVHPVSADSTSLALFHSAPAGVATWSSEATPVLASMEIWQLANATLHTM